MQQAQSHLEILESFIEDIPKTYDLTNESLDKLLADKADQLLKKFSSSDVTESKDSTELELIEFNKEVSNSPQSEEYPIGAHLIGKLALSKHYVTKIKKPVKLSVVIPMYKEHRRIKRQSEEENGENFLRRKVFEFSWLFDGSPVSWEFIYVDDGCPSKTGAVAQEIIDGDRINNTRVVYLQDGIDQDDDLLENLNIKTTKDSQKAGAVYYGFAQAIEEMKTSESDKCLHILMLTDCDMSAPLGQTGLLLKNVVDKNIPCAVGSRYGNGGICGLPDTIVLPSIHTVPVIVRIFALQKLLPGLGSITDTQCGFKVFNAKFVERMLSEMKDTKGTFDIEFLLRVTTQKDIGEHESRGEKIISVPIFWIDSPAESNFWTGDDGEADITSYLPFFKRIVKIREMFKDRFPQDDIADNLADFFAEWKVDEFKRCMEKLHDTYLKETFGFDKTFELGELKELSV